MATLSEILSRARVLATQTAGDANQSAVIDNLSGFRAYCNHVLLEIYRRKASDQKFLNDIVVRHTISMAAGSGTLPSTVMKELLQLSDITDTNNSLVTFYNYRVDYDSGVNYRQLGYCYLNGNTIKYTPPSPGMSTSYSGNLYMSTPSVPDVPTDWSDELDVDDVTLNDVILLLSMAIQGKGTFQVVST